jgi:hypothetical protein
MGRSAIRGAGQSRRGLPLPRPACGERSETKSPGEGESPRKLSTEFAEAAPHPDPLRVSFARLGPAGGEREKPRARFFQPATPSRSRRASRPSFAVISRPPRTEGAGNAGRPMRPIAACALVESKSTRVSQVTPESPGIPRAMVYGLFRALPGDRAFLPPSPAKVAFRELDASVGASGPHVFAVRFKCSRQLHHRRPPHPAPRP